MGFFGVKKNDIHKPVLLKQRLLEEIPIIVGKTLTLKKISSLFRKYALSKGLNIALQACKIDDVI